MRFTPNAVERLMRNGYIRYHKEHGWRFLDAGFEWLRHRKEAV